ncbi:MAG TPA: hypothetical protein VHZ51_10595 [Ktedonobacteraceae bacterium]|jgi:hypothetical protein|nr:hypothetical protein [Ktedonobacteraceae bacterium]
MDVYQNLAQYFDCLYITVQATCVNAAPLVGMTPEVLALYVYGQLQEEINGGVLGRDWVVATWAETKERIMQAAS